VTAGLRDLGLLRPGLAAFWAVYFGLVAGSNLTDLLGGIHLLPAGWGWRSGNLAFIAQSTGRLGVPGPLNLLLLAGVVAWQAAAMVLFARAAVRPDAGRLAPALLVSLALWATFILLDELLLIFETGAEATHLRLFGAELLTVLVLGQLGGWPAARREPAPPAP
jgi:hypothetical protein